MYTLTRREIQLMNAADGTSTSTVGRASCGTRPFTVRRASMMVTTAGTTTAVVVTLKKRVTPGTDTGGTTIGTMTAASATDVAGTAYYLNNLSTEISYGDEVYAVVSTAGGGSLKIDVNVEVEDTPSSIASQTAVTLVTA